MLLSPLHSLSPDSDHVNQSLKEESRPQTPPSSSLNMDPNNKFSDNRRRPGAYRRNRKKATWKVKDDSNVFRRNFYNNLPIQ